MFFNLTSLLFESRDIDGHDHACIHIKKNSRNGLALLRPDQPDLPLGCESETLHYVAASKIFLIKMPEWF